jgi:hypothetical protein
LIRGKYDFARVFLASFGARHICANARPNWNKGAPLTYVLAFGRSIYQFTKPTTKLRIENVFNVVGALTHKGMKLLSQ